MHCEGFRWALTYVTKAIYLKEQSHSKKVEVWQIKYSLIFIFFVFLPYFSLYLYFAFLFLFNREHTLTSLYTSRERVSMHARMCVCVCTHVPWSPFSWWASLEAICLFMPSTCRQTLLQGSINLDHIGINDLQV